MRETNSCDSENRHYISYKLQLLITGSAGGCQFNVQGDVIRVLTVGQSTTTIKPKVKGQGRRSVLNQWSRLLFSVNGQWHIYIFTINFNVQFIQVYGVTQNYKQLTILSRDVKIAVIVFLMFLITSNVVSLAAVPITHQDIIIKCRCVQKTTNTWTNK